MLLKTKATCLKLLFLPARKSLHYRSNRTPQADHSQHCTCSTVILNLLHDSRKKVSSMFSWRAFLSTFSYAALPPTGIQVSQIYRWKRIHRHDDSKVNSVFRLTSPCPFVGCISHSSCLANRAKTCSSGSRQLVGTVLHEHQHTHSRCRLKITSPRGNRGNAD